MQPITYPARPLSGGRFGLVPKSRPHLWSHKLNGWRALVHKMSSLLRLPRPVGVERYPPGRGCLAFQSGDDPHRRDSS